MLVIIVSSLLLGLSLGLIARCLDRANLRKHTTVIAEYDAPSYLTPAELGYFVDSSFGDAEILGTLVALIQKGYVVPVRHEDSDLYLKLGHMKPAGLTKLTGAELSVVTWLREHKRPLGLQEITSHIHKSFGNYAVFEQEVHDQLVEKGYLTTKTFLSLAQNRRLWWSATGLAIVTTALLAFVSAENIRSNIGIGSYTAVELYILAVVATPVFFALLFAWYLL
jgi:hypothetical protein